MDDSRSPDGEKQEESMQHLSRTIIGQRTSKAHEMCDTMHD